MVSSKSLNSKVKKYKQEKNFDVCGSGYKKKKIGKKRHEIIFKNDCEEYKLISEWTITLDQTTWATVRTLPVFVDGEKFTHISYCKKFDNGTESCMISLREINGVM